MSPKKSFELNHEAHEEHEANVFLLFVLFVFFVVKNDSRVYLLTTRISRNFARSVGNSVFPSGLPLVLNR